MKQLAKYILYIIPVIVFSGCSGLADENPYADALNTITIVPTYPEGLGNMPSEGVTVRISDMDKGTDYTLETGRDGKAYAKVTNGNYRITVSYRTDDFIFNGSADRVRIAGENRILPVRMTVAEPGKIVIKEIYCGGCLKYPQEGNYQSDSYLILHNNTDQIQYLDSLCIGTLDPYNAIGTNVWIGKDENGASLFQDFAPVIQAVWKIKGDGKTFPLKPGEDAVVCIFGAIDHTSQYPMSVNLNKPEYFVCYNLEYFPNTLYHPVPGDKILPERNLDVVVKTGQAKAYTFSFSSPAVVIFKAKGTTIEKFTSEENSLMQKPGSNVDKIVKLPLDWIIDGVEVFTGNASGNTKRINPAIDAGYVKFSAPFMGHTLFRKTDKTATEKKGFEVLEDTNNSMNDFYEREKQSLHE